MDQTGGTVWCGMYKRGVDLQVRSVLFRALLAAAEATGATSKTTNTLVEILSSRHTSAPVCLT